jgi:hypothetical protein
LSRARSRFGCFDEFFNLRLIEAHGQGSRADGAMKKINAKAWLALAPHVPHQFLAYALSQISGNANWCGMLVATASPARTVSKNSQLIRSRPDESYAYFGDRTLVHELSRAK